MGTGGCKWENHWAWIKPTRNNNQSPKNAIDGFIKKTLSKKN